jgi:hypothetical protein
LNAARKAAAPRQFAKQISRGKGGGKKEKFVCFQRLADRDTSKFSSRSLSSVSLARQPFLASSQNKSIEAMEAANQKEIRLLSKSRQIATAQSS